MTSYRPAPQLSPKLRGELHTAFRQSAPSALYHAQTTLPIWLPTSLILPFNWMLNFSRVLLLFSMPKEIRNGTLPTPYPFRVEHVSYGTFPKSQMFNSAIDGDGNCCHWGSSEKKSSRRFRADFGANSR